MRPANAREFIVMLRDGYAAEPAAAPDGGCGSGEREFEAEHTRGYTNGMKTAVSIPDQIFEQAERLARQTRKSRSHVFSSALREYVARHSPDDVTEAMDRVCADVGAAIDPFVARASRRQLEQTEW